MNPEEVPENPEVDMEATKEKALQFIEKEAAERRGEEYVAPPTQEELVKLGMEKAVKVVPEVEVPEALPVETATPTAPEVATDESIPLQKKEKLSFFQKIRQSVGLRAAGAAIVLGVPAVTAAGCAPDYNLQVNQEQQDQRKVDAFMAEYAAEWSGGQEVPGLKVELIKPVLGSSETTASVYTWMHVGEYHIVIPQGYSIQRLAINGEQQQVLTDVWSGPLDGNFSFYFTGTLAVFQDGNPNPIGSFTPHGL